MGHMGDYCNVIYKVNRCKKKLYFFCIFYDEIKDENIIFLGSFTLLLSVFNLMLSVEASCGMNKMGKRFMGGIID